MVRSVFGRSAGKWEVDVGRGGWYDGLEVGECARQGIGGRRRTR